MALNKIYKILKEKFSFTKWEDTGFPASINA